MLTSAELIVIFVVRRFFSMSMTKPILPVSSAMPSVFPVSFHVPTFPMSGSTKNVPSSANVYAFEPRHTHVPTTSARDTFGAAGGGGGAGGGAFAAASFSLNEGPFVLFRSLGHATRTRSDAMTSRR